jgi:hypothetical protein
MRSSLGSGLLSRGMPLLAALALCGCDSSGADKGEATDAGLNLVAPEADGLVYTFTSGDTVFAVDADRGGRIVTFSLAGRNAVTTPKSQGDINWGSTFWTSPQSDWNWPPPPEIDSDTYAAKLEGGTLTLTSETSSKLDVAVSKKFSMDRITGNVTIEYTIINKGSQARSLAPWEITRVAAGGLTFFPMGEGSPTQGKQDLLNLQVSGGAAWLAYDAASIPKEQKVFADGHEGWIAHSSDGFLLVKALTDMAPSQAAPGEAEISLYTDTAHTYIEVENEGPYQELAPGTSLSYTTHWFLRKLDASVPVQVGSAELLSTVRALVRP